MKSEYKECRNKRIQWRRQGVIGSHRQLHVYRVTREEMAKQNDLNSPKVNSYVGSPEATKAVITADGPGIGITGIWAPTQASTCKTKELDQCSKVCSDLVARAADLVKGTFTARRLAKTLLIESTFFTSN